MFFKFHNFINTSTLAAIQNEPSPMRNLICLFVFCIVGCANDGQVGKKPYAAKVALADKVYFFGPAVDSTSTDVLAECDCCASEILFEKDSSFIAAFYCLEENTYAKGTFSVIADKLILTYAPEDVIKRNDTDAEYGSATYKKTSNFQVTTRQIPKSTLSISFLNAKTVLSTDGEEKDFGMESKEQTRLSFLAALRKDSVLHYLNID
ncbi:MAG: hypothetical protein M3Q06_00245 [Bacteroidota bacterium]|nr:hypothetical protein [Bacteroidota bacterium]